MPPVDSEPVGNAVWQAGELALAELMVSTAGDYRFADFVCVGLPLTLVVLVMSVVLVPLVFPL